MIVLNSGSEMPWRLGARCDGVMGSHSQNTKNPGSEMVETIPWRLMGLKKG